MFSSVNKFSRLAKFVPNARNFFPSKLSSKPFLHVGRNVQNARTITRSLWFLCENRTPVDSLGSITLGQPWTSKCSCGCSLHTQAEKELAAFLDEEIDNERKAQKSAKELTVLGDFESKVDGSEIVLTRKFHNETITVKINVNHSVNSEVDQDDMFLTDEERTKQPPKAEEMKSKPNFSVAIEKNGKVLSFMCCYSEAILDDSTDVYSDVFQITELALYEGEVKDSTYSVSAEIMDGYLYDMLMDILKERGISHDFGIQLIDFCSSYEHKLYIGLLERMKKYFSEK